MRASIPQCLGTPGGANSEWHPAQWTDVGGPDEDGIDSYGKRLCVPSPLARHEQLGASHNCHAPQVGLFEEASTLTATLLDAAGTQGQSAALKRWFAWALEQHQAATRQYIASQHSELKTAMEQTFQQALGGMAARTWPSSNVEDTQRLDEIDAQYKRSKSGGSPYNSKRRANYLGRTDLGVTSTSSDVVNAFNAPGAKRPRSARGRRRTGTDSSLSSGSADRDDVPMGPQDSEQECIPAEPGWRKFLRYLDGTAIAVVMANSLCMYFQLDLQGREIAEQMSLKGAAPDAWRAASSFLRVLDYFFNAFFVVELLIKLVLLRAKYFKEIMNLIDCTVVVVNAVGLFFMRANVNASLARLTRFLKVLRLIRMSRIAVASNDLRILISTLYVSMKSLIWSAVLLGIIIVVAGLVMAQFVGMYLVEDCFSDDELCEWAYIHYGSASRASWTMFRVTFSGGWSHWADLLIEQISAWYLVFWLLYIVVVWFAVIRIVTALFLKQTMDVASSDQEMQIIEKMRTKTKFAGKLKDFFSKCDLDGDGMIQYSEFTQALADPKAKAWLQTLEIDVAEVEQLFDMLDDGDGAISFDEFLGGAVRVRGVARAIDQFAIIHSLNKLSVNLECVQDVLVLLARRR